MSNMKLGRGGFNEPHDESPLTSVPCSPEEAGGIYIRDETQVKLDRIIVLLETIATNTKDTFNGIKAARH